MATTYWIEGVELTAAAANNVEETGCSPSDDVTRVRSGEQTREGLLAHCLDGADLDRVQGWRDYVDAICNAAAGVFTVEVETLNRPVRYADGEIATHWVRVWRRDAIANTGRSFDSAAAAMLYADGIMVGLRAAGFPVALRVREEVDHAFERLQKNADQVKVERAERERIDSTWDDD